MRELRALSPLPFVPSGADYDGSRRLFADLGFDEIWEHDGYAGFRNGPAQFILQRLDNPTFAGNFMVRLNVPDLEAWWQDVSRRQLPRRYPPYRPELELDHGAHGRLHRGVVRRAVRREERLRGRSARTRVA